MAYLKNTTVEQVKSFIRQPYAWPGGYPLILVMTDGECLCADCAALNQHMAIHRRGNKTMTIKQIATIAKSLGLVRGKGAYNGAAYWVRPGSSAIVTAERVLELAGYGA